MAKRVIKLPVDRRSLKARELQLPSLSTFLEVVFVIKQFPLTFHLVQF